MHVEVQQTSSPAVRDAESRFFAAVVSSAAWYLRYLESAGAVVGDR
jgi:hypothetical protein